MCAPCCSTLTSFCPFHLVCSEDSDLIRIETISDLDTDYLEKLVKGSKDDQEDDGGDGDGDGDRDGDESEGEELDV